MIQQPNDSQVKEQHIDAEETTEKALYETPQLIVHGSVEKLTLQTGIPGGI